MTVFAIDPARFPFIASVQCRHVDLDAQKVLSNVAFSELFEEARTRYSLDRKLKPIFDPLKRVLCRVSIEFHVEGRYPAEISVAVGVKTVELCGWTLLLFAFQNGVLIASCESQFILASDESQAELPQGLIKLLKNDLVPSLDRGTC